MTTITEKKNNTINKTTISSTNNISKKHSKKYNLIKEEENISNKESKHNTPPLILETHNQETRTENISRNLDITKLAYKKINDNYSKAKYGDFDVIMDMNTGYINATNLCVDGGKQLKDWFMNDSNKEVVESYIKLFNINTLTYSINGCNITETSGTYVHPKLITHITSWVYPSFAWKVSELVNNHLIKENEDEITLLSEHKNKLEKMFEESENRRMESDKINKQLLNDIIHQNHINFSKLDKIHHKIYKNTDIIKRLETRLEKIVEEVVPPIKQLSLHEYFGIMKINNPIFKRQYKVYYGLKKDIKKIRTSILATYRNAVILKEVGPYPNTHNFLRQIKEKYSRGMKSKLQISYNFINLNYETTEQDLINILDEVIENNKNCID